LTIYACAVNNPQTYALRVATITQRWVLAAGRSVQLDFFCSASRSMEPMAHVDWVDWVG
jgi:hypothetical protein